MSVVQSFCSGVGTPLIYHMKFHASTGSSNKSHDCYDLVHQHTTSNSLHCLQPQQVQLLPNLDPEINTQEVATTVLENHRQTVGKCLGSMHGSV